MRLCSPPPSRLRENARLCRPAALAVACFLVVAASPGVIRGEDVAADAAPDAAPDPTSVDTPAGHSLHGEAFNEGPRQAAEILSGMAKIEFPTSSKSGSAQRFVEQGVSQLHGFLYLEAERSFRQAASDDPKLAIAYWGMAMANVNNSDRARGLIDEAMKLRKGNTDRRERMYIESLDRFLPKKADKDAEPPSREEAREAKKKRVERFIADWEDILHEFPDDLEAKAFLVVTIWSGARDGVKITSRYAIEALLDQIFADNPMHPSHHYRIHLWDSARPENALVSAANCGPSSPGIAHMWHMPGHIYSKLKRYNDAAWQQEASARVDHAHMIRTRLLPDQIHNFSHNNEWLVRNLLYVGRVQDALDLSTNLVSLPRHPKYNTIDKGSYRYGRMRLVQTLSQYGLWDEMIRHCGSDSLAPTDKPIEQENWLGWLAVAQFKSGKAKEGARTLRSLQRRRLALQGQLLDVAEAKANRADGDDASGEAGGSEKSDEAGGSDESEKSEKSEKSDESDESDEDALPTSDEIKKHLDGLRPIIARASAAAASHRRDVKGLVRHADTAKLDALIRAQWLADAGDLKAALELARKEVKSGEGQVRPLAVLVDLLWRSDKADEAKKEFGKLRKVAAVADRETPMLAKLQPVIDASGIEGDWRIVGPAPEDLGERPPLGELGPFRWQPWTAPTWGAKTADGELVAGEEFEGRPRIMVFYLGFGCLHCMEQLHALEPRIDEFAKRGIDVVAISTESVEDLKTGMTNYDKKMSIPLLSDGDHHVFDAFGCWDDFEDVGLHGTFLIDSRGRVRWQDVGHEPFMDMDFLLEESARLLAVPVGS